jgi:anthranilate phosphoribosyltransferase
MILEAIRKLLSRGDLDEKEAAVVMAEIMEGKASHAQIAAYLVALRLKGETVSELVGSVRCMRDHALTVEIGDADAVDLCGTGGDGKHTFNISTTCAFVVAGSGVKVAKHGNRAASSRCGSADLLEALGVRIGLQPEQVARCIEEVGLGFMFAPVYHPAMKNVAPVRKDLGIRTIFNVLGPLANPARVTRQMIGVFDSALLEDIAHALRGLGTKTAVIVHGQTGYDEATTTDINKAAVLRRGEVSTMTVDPAELGFPTAKPHDLKGGSQEENAEITRRILEGEEGPRTDTVLLNSALALMAAERAAGLDEGIALARESIESGKAKEVLSHLVQVSLSLAGENR